MDKRGEVTTQQIVLIIILIISFVVILYFIFRLNPGQVSEEQICRNSVIIKTKAEGFAGDFECKTSYTCVSGEDGCGDFKFTQNVNAKSEEEIMKILAEEMSSCWYMFGEGKIDSGVIEGGKNFFLSSDETSCGVCSLVSFSSSLSEFGFTYGDFYNYLEKNKRDNQESYLQYLYGVSDLSSFSQNLERYKLENIDFQEGVDFSDKYFVITGYDPEAFGKDVFVYPSLVKEDDLELKTKNVCDNFDLTKA